MRLNEAERARLRTYPQWSRLFAGVQRGVHLLTAEVDGNHPKGAKTIRLRNVSGNAERGMTVRFGLDYGGNEFGESVVVSFSGSELTLPENSLILVDAMKVTVTSIFNVWRLDDPPFSGQWFYPVPIMGPSRGAFVGESVSFCAQDSFHPDPNAFIQSFRWDFADGIIESGSVDEPGSPAFPVSVRFDTPGERVVKLTVTDSNGRSATAYRTVMVFNRYGENIPYKEIEINELSGTTNGGWTCQCKIYGEADPSKFPDETLVVLWAEDYYGSEKASVASIYPWAGNIVFTGWIRRGSVECNPEEPSVTFELVSLEQKFLNLNLPGMSFVESVSPSNWHEFSGMNLGKIMMHIIQQHTNLPLLGDILVYSGNYRVAEFDTKPGTASEVFNSLLSPVFGYVSGGRLGTVAFLRDKNSMEPSIRTQFGPAIYQFTHDDYLSLEVREKLEQETAQVILSGLDPERNSVEAVYPVGGPDSHGKISKHSGLIFLNLDQAASLAGQIFAKENCRLERIVIQTGNYRILEPAHQDYFSVFLEPGDSLRRYDWTSTQGSVGNVAGAEFIADRVSIRFSDGAFTTTIEGIGSIYGPKGSSRVVPPEPEPEPPPEPIPGPLPTPSPYPGGPETGQWRSKVYILTQHKGVFYSDNFTGPGGAMPTWVQVNGGIDESELRAFEWMQPDPFAPGTRQYVLVFHKQSGQAATKLYRRVGGGNWQCVAYAKQAGYPQSSGFDLNSLNWAGETVRIRKADGSEISRVVAASQINPETLEKCNPYFVHTNINTKGYVGLPTVVSFNFQSGGSMSAIVWLYSLDYGETWRKQNYGCEFSTSPIVALLGAFRGSSAYPAGNVLYCSAQVGWFYGDHNTLYMSADRGASWQSVYRGTMGGLMMDTTQDTVYRWGWDGNENNPQLFRSTDYGRNWVPIMPAPSSNGLKFTCNFGTYGGAWSIPVRYAISPVYNGGKNRATKIHAIGIKGDPIFGTAYYYRTTDAGASWTVQQEIPAFTNDGARFYKSPGVGTAIGLSIVHDAADFLYLMSDDQNGCKLAVTADGCRTIWNKAGAHWNQDNATDSIPKNSGVIRHILQVWAQ